MNDDKAAAPHSSSGVDPRLSSDGPTRWAAARATKTRCRNRIGALIVCCRCDQPIAPGENRVEEPPTHIACARAAGYWSDSSDLDEMLARREAPPVCVDRLRSLGWCWTGPWYEASATRAEYPNREAYWDSPSHLPWVVVSQTPCPFDTGTPAQGPSYPGQPFWGKYTCRHKHLHPGKAPA